MALLFLVAEFGYFYLIPRGWRHSPFLLPYREGAISVFLHLLLGGIINIVTTTYCKNNIVAIFYYLIIDF